MMPAIIFAYLIFFFFDCTNCQNFNFPPRLQKYHLTQMMLVPSSPFRYIDKIFEHSHVAAAAADPNCVCV